jgi:oligoendopeptidase F
VQSPFYVFQYATSRAAASLLHRSMTTGTSDDRIAAAARFLDLLRAGGSDQPLGLLRKAGVDFATSGPLEALVATMEELLDQLEEALDDVGRPPRRQ